MRIIVCLPDPEDREVCTNKITELAAETGAPVTVTRMGLRSSKDLDFHAEELEKADLIFLGIEPGGFDGMAAAAAIRQKGTDIDIVFYTKEKSRVFDAFDVDAIHYLVPGEFSSKRFRNVFEKALARSRRRDKAVIRLSCAGLHKTVPIARIYYFEVTNRILTVHYEGGVFEFYSTMYKVEEKLKDFDFVRIHRSFLVARGFIADITHSEVTLFNGEKLPVGGRYLANLEKKS
jgi:DNA-binding LytR/AlgR family response regulator